MFSNEQFYIKKIEGKASERISRKEIRMLDIDVIDVQLVVKGSVPC